jgi:hypothetical protein
MQVRAIEFQENFRLVTFEASRLQSVLQRDAVEVTQKAASALSAERLHNLERPNPTDQSEHSRHVSESESRSKERQQSTEKRSSEEGDDTPSEDRQPQGSGIDLFA